MLRRARVRARLRALIRWCLYGMVEDKAGKFLEVLVILTVCLEVMSLMTKSCGQNKRKSEPRVAQ
jgi:hypothetical protein